MTPKQWLGIVAEHGPVIQGEGPTQLHHVVGRTGKHNKVLIGPWFVLPLPWQYHDVASGDSCNVTHFRHNFTRRFGLQKDLFLQMVERIRATGESVPHGLILKAIEDTNR